MNRVYVVFALFIFGVPRASGDEPTTLREELEERMCSPRERG